MKLPDDRLTTVDVIVPLRNEEEHLPKLAHQILEQSHLPRMVFLVVAPSQDATLSIARALERKYSLITVLENSRITAPHAMNLALELSSADAWIRIDGHTSIPHNLIETLLDELNNSGAACVGPTLVSGSTSRLQRAIGTAMSSPIGVGNARFRVGVKAAGPTDAVAFGLYRRTVTDQVGPYEADLDRNEDDQYNTRIRRLGHEIWLTPDVTVTYFPRKSIRALWRQYFDYGYWRFTGTILYGNELRIRQAAPGALLVSLGVSVLMLRFGRRRGAAVLVPGAYSAAIAYHGYRTRRAGTDGCTTTLSMLAAVTMHFAYGLGSLVALGDALRKFIRNQKKRVI